MNWNEYFFSLCDTVKQKSKDPSTKVGCVIATQDNRILSVGFNGFPSGVKDLSERYDDREIKYMMVVHSEANAIVTAARLGTSLNNSVLYVPWMPCHECAKLIIQSGISKLVIGDYSADGLNDRWSTSWKYSLIMFNESGVELEYYGCNKENN